MYPNLAAYQKVGGTTKDQIINVLSYDWPLSARKIYNLVKKRYGNGITYQAVYKAIVQMLQEKILAKTKEGYQLNLKWIKEIHDQTEMIRANYYSEQRATLLDNENLDSIRVFIFKAWFDVEKYLYYLQKNYVKNSKEKQMICVHQSHEWQPLFYFRAEYNWFDSIAKQGHKTLKLCSGNSFADRWASEIYKKLGAKSKTNAKCADNCELMVFSDLVIQIYIPEELKRNLEQALNKVNKLENLDLNWLIKNVFEKETEIKVVINKDKKIADEIRKQTIRQFS